jgi:hypothetical protein
MSEIDKLLNDYLGLTSGYFGYKVIAADEGCSKLVQARRHKKKRIDKKWRKRYGYKRVPTSEIYVFENKIFAHSRTIDKLRIALENRKD